MVERRRGLGVRRQARPFRACLCALLAFACAGCLERRDATPTTDSARCASCHGDPTRPGDFLERSAPPHDLSGSTDPSYPGVGAHQIHLQASATHAALRCDECHTVPERTDSPGHADSAGPAELVFGTLARKGDRDPVYGPTRTCSDTYCHGDARAVWTAPRDSVQACGSCHGLPPKAPHPQSERCSACHGEVVDADRHIIAPSLHVDGVVERAAPSCTACHGSGDDPAPPIDTHGNVSVSATGVGAHRAHLRENALGRSLACAECHRVPEPADASSHVDGLAATVTFSSVATSGGHDAAHFDATTGTCAETWCHGAASSGHGSSPEWTSAASLSCTSCHGSPPAAPHPQMTECSLCHGAVVHMDGAKATIMEPSLHVDGHVDLALEERCTGCHGDVNAAPPLDTSGHTSTSASGVGAHQTHVLGTARARAVRCDECHTVPDQVLASGHVDSARPAEVRLTGTAGAFGGAPVYVAGSCRDTSCHGAVFPDGDASGGTNPTPTWTKVDGTEAACGSCHALPPPAPHPYVALNPVCSKCHSDIAADNRTFVRPDLHVDGIVTFELP